MDKSSPRTILMGLYELPAGQLGPAPPSSGIHIQQCHERSHWCLPVLCEQGLPPETVNEPASPVIVLRGSTLHGRPGPTARPTESVDRRGPGMLPESSGLPADAVTSLQDWRPCICESEVLPHNLTFKETGREEPGTVRDNRHPRHALCYSPPPATIPRGPPRVPCLPTQTYLPEPLPAQRTTPPPPITIKHRNTFK